MNENGSRGAGYGAAAVSEEHSGGGVRQHLASKATWTRLPFMVVFRIFGQPAAVVAMFVVVPGFLWVSFTGETNDWLTRAGQGIAACIGEVFRYLTFNTGARPFPFDADWPDANAGSGVPGA